MSCPKPGDRVRVTFEAVYESKGHNEGHYFEARNGDAIDYYVPTDATLEVIKPPFPEEPQEKGSIVRILFDDGSSTVFVRTNHSTEPWDNVSYGGRRAWEGILDTISRYEGTVLQVASFESPKAETKPAELIDNDGDKWTLRGHGLYQLSWENDNEDKGRTRQYIAETHGLRST